MLKVEGFLLGAGVRAGEDKTRLDGTPYRTDDRYKVCLGAGDMSLPTYYDCDSRQVMESIASAAKFGQQVTLSARADRYGRLSVTGFAPSVRAS